MGTRSTHIKPLLAAGAAQRSGSGGTTAAVPLQRRFSPRSARAACVAPCSGPVPLHRSIAVRVQRLAGWCAEARVACIRKCHHPAVIPSPTARPFVLAPTALRSTAASQPCPGSGACGSARFGPLHAHITAVCIGRARCKVLSTTGAIPRRAAGPATLESIQSARARLRVRTSPLSRPFRRKLQVRRHHPRRRRRPRRWTTRAHRRILQV